ncbi:MAG: hypothetical protein M3Z09_16540 [Acidobacteriota bacterium]|nr:hypothetical protein [Acidobacteriota bacterium]
MRRLLFTFQTCVLTAAGICCFHGEALGQTTQVDLKTQSKSVDFSRAGVTKPFKTGTALPAACGLGEAFFKTDAAAGQNMYGCTAANTWTPQGAGVGLPGYTNNAGQLLSTNGSQAGWTAAGGDLSGPPQSFQVTGLQGKPVSSAAPMDGQVLRWNAANLDWEPGTVAGGSSGASSNTGGDLFGLVTNATVTRIQNKPVSSATATDGQVLTWSQAGGLWQPQSPGGAVAGTGNGPASLSGVIGVTYTSGNTLTIGAGCSSASPCNVRFGTTVISVASSSSVTLLSGSGTAYFYVTASGTVSVGSNLGVSCSGGCSTVSGIANFPVNSLPVFMWTAVGNSWDANGGRDVRAYLSGKLISAGTGMLLVDSGQQSTVAVDTTLIPTYLVGTANLNFGTLAPGSCSSDLTVAAVGAVPGDAVATGWPAALPGSILGMMRVSAVDTVAVRLCNLSATSAAAPPASYRAMVVKGL